jgi:hypothetical protein
MALHIRVILFFTLPFTFFRRDTVVAGIIEGWGAV